MFNRVLASLLFAGLFCQAQEQSVSTPPVTPQPLKKSYQFDLAAMKQWLDTGIDLLAAARLSITATGSLQYLQAKGPATPDGMTRGWKDLIRMMPVNESGRG